MADITLSSVLHASGSPIHLVPFSFGFRNSCDLSSNELGQGPQLLICHPRRKQSELSAPAHLLDRPAH